MYLVHFKSDYLRQQQLCAALAFVVLRFYVLRFLSPFEGPVCGAGCPSKNACVSVEFPHCCHHRRYRCQRGAPINRLLLFTIFASPRLGTGKYFQIT